ncbi:MAG TPA: hypothetical protein VG106_03025 [Vicinamibacterales bacterium]|nr:hypothetical protein [Vicinamibacterales bacterium]
MEQDAGKENMDDRSAADPYGDVALGVECAWPETIPFEHDDSADTRQSVSHP